MVERDSEKGGRGQFKKNTSPRQAHSNVADRGGKGDVRKQANNRVSTAVAGARSLT